MFKVPTATTEQTSFTTHNQLFQPWEFLVCFSTDDWLKMEVLLQCLPR